MWIKWFFIHLVKINFAKLRKSSPYILDFVVNYLYDSLMSRPREFDVDKVLNQSMEVFWAKGYKATSFEDLTNKTHVKKQSLYGVFEDKRSLFLKALALYRAQNLDSLREVVDRGGSPTEILDAVKSASLCSKNEDSRNGCLMVNTALEFGISDEEVTNEVEKMFSDVQLVLEEVISKGQALGEITTRFTSKELGAFLANALRGTRILEKTGVPVEQIETILNTSFGLIKK
ncbi:TetR/AcrR family transcriptional repressor of nem operon [Paenibacillus sp. V4I3]|uniref:TetR/AcrR family transcriptional regulator n=1 Tax=Paenibacillus sp. V4I3 TaxID=3042305 RepID=UPI0027852C32|nr:TetR/AcrR family transcriptional regulator [Paenibacillus sp. V4I3]MDQ0878418.1 TetR/AcrR family transcriptional repressor of nem operon [Paenibacillus sp. V4I3]